MLRSFFLQGRKWIRRLVVLLIPGTADSPERAKQVRRDPAETKPPADEEQQPVKDVADGSAGKTSPPSPAHSPASQPDTNPRVAPTEVDGHDRKTDGESSAPPDTTESQRPPISHHRQRSSPGHDHSASDQTAPASEVDTEGRDAQSNGEKQEGSKRRGKVKKREPSPPRQIGGRRHRLTQTQPSSPPTPESRPEVICRRPLGSVQWEVVLSTGFPDGVVKHDGKPIMPVNGEWSISSFDRHLSIDRGDGSPIQISLFDGSPMIFKLKKDWSGDGRKVIRITRGHFIVIVPAGWVRKGRVPHEPDPCSDCTFTAHYFFRDGSESHEELGGFGGHEIDWSGPAFRLSGKRVFDDSDHGLLFTGPQPPRMNRAERVVWGRVGEEATDGWKGLNFRTSESLADVLDGRQGHFFLRAYDEQSAMLDSVEFRYLRGLREIRVNGEPYAKDTLLVPPATGHHPTKVQFVGIDGLRVRLAPSARTAIEEDAKASLVVNPHPDADHVTCDVEADDGRVAVVVHLPRVWWRMEPEDGDERGEWRSIPFDMSREEFQEYAYSGAAVRMRLPRRIGSTLVGFGDELDRNYDMEGNDVTLPLSHFVDHDQIDQPLFADALLNVRLCPSDDPTPSSPVTLIRVNPDAQPTVELFTCKPRAVAAGENSLLSWVTRQTEGVRVVIDPEVGDVGPVGTHEIAPLETGTYTLRLTAPGMEDVTEQVMVQVQPTRHSSSRAVAKVKRGGGGWRHGRGFSHSEVHAAGQATNFKLTRTVLCEKGKPVHKGTIVKMTSPANRIGQRLARLSYQGRHIVTCLANEVGRYGRVLSDSRKGTAAIKVDRRRRSKHPVNIRTLRKETND